MSNTKKQELQQLLDKMLAGNEKAFKEVFMRFSDRFFLWTSKCTGDKDVAKDFVQEFFVNIWENRSKLSFTPSSFPAYAFKSLYNKSIDYLRAKSKVASPFEIQLDVDDNVDPYLLEELHNRLESAIEDLPDRCKEIFKMAKIQKKSYAEIASEFGISENTVKVQVSKAYHILRRKMN